MSDPIDRLSPRERPAGRVVMKQTWSRLSFLHWSFDPGEVASLLPAGLTLDTFEGRAYVGLVPFTMTGVRPVYLPPLAPLSNFHETNVRTYVHMGGRDPGVWFFSLDAANWAAVKLARAWFNLPYFFASMSLVASVDGATTRVRYESERRDAASGPASVRVATTTTGPVLAAAPGTLEFFLAERYVLYAKTAAGLSLGRVHHAPYPLQTARADECVETVFAATGLRRPPSEPLTHFASGVSVEVYPLERVALR